MNKKEENSNVDALRHSMAHILATAVQDLYPGAKFGVGPVIDHGFYYDFDLDQTISEDDLVAIQKKMKEVVKARQQFEREEMDINDAIEYFEGQNQPYKVELLHDLKKHGTTAAKDIVRGDTSSQNEVTPRQYGVDQKPHSFVANDEKITTVTLYKNGSFTDLCRGGHLENTGQAGAFKLTKVSGAYWRGDQANPQMQRVYGVAFESKDELNTYLRQQEEAKKRDHRKIGQEMDLFTFSDPVGPGLPMWTPRGTAIRSELQKALVEFSQKFDVGQVTTPHIAKIELYEKSGHAQKFGNELFKVKGHYQDFILKPVSCPHHTQLYASRPRSYRDLPIRYMESAMQYRDEKPGEISGLTRVRSITVDDGHTFCRVDQIKEEAKSIAEVIQQFYTVLGMYGDHWVSLSVRDPKQPQDYIGDDEGWNQAETLLQEVSDDLGLNARRMEGEAALYGPKLDFMFKDALGNERQLSTIQVDFAMPARFGLTYNDQDGSEKTPVMLHRAILGSYERFMAILIEHYAGKFPVWLAPEQVRLISVNQTDKIVEKAQQMLAKLKQNGIRAELDNSSESVGKKIREASMQKVPYTIVVGEKEVEADEVSPRIRDDLGGESASLAFESFVGKVKEEIASRASKSSI